MAEHYFPFSSGAGVNANQADWGSMFAAMGTPGVLMDEGNELLVTSIGGNQVSVDIGRAHAFGTGYHNDAPKTLTVSANGTGSIRFDRVSIMVDYVANTAVAGIVAGTNTAPQTLLSDRANKVEISLAILAVPPGSGSVASGDIFVALDRWAAPTNAQQIGVLVDYLGTLANAPKNLVPAYGQIVTSGRWNYEKLWAVMPTQGGSGTAPFHGRRNNGSNDLVMPDLRGRSVVGLDRMGQGSGHDAGRIDAADTLGQFLGDNGIVADDIAPHLHLILPRLSTGGDSMDSDLFVVNRIPPGGRAAGSYFIKNLANQGTGHAAFEAGDHEVGVVGLNQLFSDWGIPKDGDWNDAHTEFGPSSIYDPNTGASTQNPDSKMNPAILGYKLLKVA